MDLQLTNRVALIAASSQGLGYATALQLSREGAHIAVNSRDEANVHAAADAIRDETGNPVLGVVADVANPEDIERLVKATVEEYGGLDILITNAAGPPSGLFVDLDDEMWQKAVDLNLMSAVRLIRAALPHLQQSSFPSVLTITSITVLQPLDNLMLSNSVRMAVIGLTKTLVDEFGGDDIRFNSILPSWTSTERVNDLMLAAATRNKTSVEHEMEQRTQQVPLERMGTAQEFANVATFLVSPAASYVNGVMLQVDGGYYRGTL